MKTKLFKTLAFVIVLSIALSSFASAFAATPIIITGTNGKGDTQSIAHENFAEKLNETGLFDAVAMVSSEMGSTDDVLEQAMAGAGVVAATDPARLAAYVPEFGILMMPYMFDSYDEIDTLLETELYAQWKQMLYDKGLVLLTNNGITGFRNYVTNKEIVEPADLAGLKIRTMGSAIASASALASARRFRNRRTELSSSLQSFLVLRRRFSKTFRFSVFWILSIKAKYSTMLRQTGSDRLHAIRCSSKEI